MNEAKLRLDEKQLFDRLEIALKMHFDNADRVRVKVFDDGAGVMLVNVMIVFGDDYVICQRKYNPDDFDALMYHDDISDLYGRIRGDVDHAIDGAKTQGVSVTEYFNQLNEK